MVRVWLVVLTAMLGTRGAAAQEERPALSVVVSERVAQEPVSGRLVLSLLHADSALYQRNSPLNAPFFSHPQPMFGLDVEAWKPGDVLALTDDLVTESFPHPVSELRPGHYRVGAYLDRSRTRGDWQDEAGNLYSEEFTLVIDEAGAVTLPALVVLSNVTGGSEDELPEPIEMVEVRSELLSAFRGEDVMLRAAVVPPLGYEEGERYGAVYVVPGFGGDHRSAWSEPRLRERLEEDDERRALRGRAFMIYLDPGGPNGHHKFADSRVNGPVGRALVEELIPAIEARFALRAEPGGRIVTGHSSGGWSAVWLALEYPEVFGAAWSSAPDPVDFRAFQKSNIYEDANVYELPSGEVSPSYRRMLRTGERVLMTVEQENRMEEVMGPGNTSGQQWDAWQAAYGPADDDGDPVALFDAETGAIDRSVAETYTRYDISAKLAADPDRYLPLLRERVRIVMGDRDNFYLEEAVRLLEERARALSAGRGETWDESAIIMVPGADHSSVRRREAVRSWAGAMVEFLREDG
jgi:hypothetical protein